ncbi:MAG: InlB B-repeat-containing protein, partial [Christensenellales bacterium]
KYLGGKITVLFESGGATSGTLPSTVEIEYAESGSENVAVTGDFVKAGYTYSKWYTTIDGIVTEFEVNDGMISVAKNITSVGRAITIRPKWEIIEYTALFITNGEYISDSDYSYNSELGGYSKKYTVEDVFAFPNAIKEGSVLVGWNVAESQTGTKWKVDECYSVEEEYSNCYGNVTFNATWVGLAFIESAENETSVKEVAKVYGDDNFTIYLKNDTNLQANFESENTSIATIVDLSYGTVKIVGTGETIISASVTIDGMICKTSYKLIVTQRDIASSEIIITINGEYEYTGNEIIPDYTIKDNLSTINKVLIKDIDFIQVSSNVVNEGNATLILAGTGNYMGEKSVEFTVSSAIIGGSISQSGTLTYNGSAQTPDISNNLTSIGGQAITVTYSTSSSGAYSTTVPTFTDAGSYTLYYKANASNHIEKSGSFAITVNQKTLSTPSNLSWSGGLALWESVPNADFYSVTLYKNGSTSTTISTTSTDYSFESNILTEATRWTFNVQAIGSGNYADSAISNESLSQITYSISYNANNGNDAPSTQYKISGVSITLSSTIPTRNGYNFLGWSTSSTATTATYSAGANYTSNSNTNLYAVWELVEITLSVIDTTSYYYIDGSLYTKGSAYHQCIYCLDYFDTTGCSVSCSSHSLGSTAYYFCSICNDY